MWAIICCVGKLLLNSGDVALKCFSTVLIVLIYVKSYLFLDIDLIYDVFVYLKESGISEHTITY